MASKWRRLCSVFTVAVLAPWCSARAGADYAVLHSFAGRDGAWPNAALLARPDGALYGTATSGGLGEDLSIGGVAFRLAPTTGGTGWTKTILHQFGKMAGDGSSPHSRLMVDRLGALYGTTYGGGARRQGTVYRLSPPGPGGTEWTETILYSFAGRQDGANPTSELVADTIGRLYGTALFGGAQGQGTVYRLSPPIAGQIDWTFELLHSFAGPEGRQPRAGLIARTVGGVLTLFGTTVSGGALEQGTVFALRAPSVAGAPWSHEILYSFTGGADGGAPLAALIADRSLTLFGTTSRGGATAASSGEPGGTVFQLLPPHAGVSTWTPIVLHTFRGAGDGVYPLGTLLESAQGRLFGTSAGQGYGGCTQHCGTAFMLTSRHGNSVLPWNETILRDFSGKDGDVPSAGLTSVLAPDGTLRLYGVTERGGTSGFGAVFTIKP